jgi:hypothetical protein
VHLTLSDTANSTRKKCGRNKILSWDFNGFTYFRHNWHNIEMVFGIPPVLFLWNNVRMCALLAPKHMDGITSYSVLNSSLIVGWSPVNTIILVPWIWALQRTHKREMVTFFGNGCNHCEILQTEIVHKTTEAQFLLPEKSDSKVLPWVHGTKNIFVENQH